MQVIYPRCAGLDVHQKSVEVTAMGDQLEPNEREIRFYFATDLTSAGLGILLAFMSYWPTEVTFEESCAHLGNQIRAPLVPYGSRMAVPLLVSLDSLVTL
jgi:hypothetical protein